MAPMSRLDQEIAAARDEFDSCSESMRVADAVYRALQRVKGGEDVDGKAGEAPKKRGRKPKVKAEVPV